MKNFLRKNGRPYDEDQVSNVGYFTGIVDFGTQEVRGWDGEPTKKRVCKVEFQFPDITRRWGDGTTGHHIKSKQVTLSTYKATDETMNNAELYNVLEALGAEDIPRGKPQILPFAKELFNTPIVIISETFEAKNGEEYDRIVGYEPYEGEPDPDFEPHNGNTYFDMYKFDRHEYETLQGFHKRKIKESPEFKQQEDEKVDEALDGGEMPF